jgi:hypothetical protein
MNVLIMLVALTAAVVSPGFAEDEKRKDEVNLTGAMDTRTILAITPEWQRIFRDFLPDKDDVASIKNSLEDRSGVTVEVVLRSTCEDSRFQVPKYLKIQELLGEKQLTTTYVGVDRTRALPAEIVKVRKVDKVPTFIIYEDGKEIGRIVETPKETVEADLAKILSEK